MNKISWRGYQLGLRVNSHFTTLFYSLTYELALYTTILNCRFFWLHKCWWRTLKTKCVGDNLGMLMTDFIHSEITNITKIVANIMILPPTSEISHHYKVTNITMSPTSLSPIFSFYFVKIRILDSFMMHEILSKATSGGYFRNSKVLLWTQIQFWILWLKICRLLNLFLAFLPD